MPTSKNFSFFNEKAGKQRIASDIFPLQVIALKNLQLFRFADLNVHIQKNILLIIFEGRKSR